MDIGRVEMEAAAPIGVAVVTLRDAGHGDNGVAMRMGGREVQEVGCVLFHLTRYALWKTKCIGFFFLPKNPNI